MAETSITIDDVTVVIDAGRAKEMGYDSARGIACLQVTDHCTMPQGLEPQCQACWVLVLHRPARTLQDASSSCKSQPALSIHALLPASPAFARQEIDYTRLMSIVRLEYRAGNLDQPGGRAAAAGACGACAAGRLLPPLLPRHLGHSAGMACQAQLVPSKKFHQC